MYRTIRSLAAIAAIATAAACGDGASPTESSFVAPDAPLAAKPSNTRLNFSYTQSQTSQQSQTATGGVGTIDFTGSLTTGTPCVDVTATHSVASSTVTLTVSAVSDGMACIQVITYNNYQGDISRLDPGTYTFNVVHEVGGSRTTAYSSSVVVL